MQARVEGHARVPACLQLVYSVWMVSDVSRAARAHHRVLPAQVTSCEPASGGCFSEDVQNVRIDISSRQHML